MPGTPSQKTKPLEPWLSEDQYGLLTEMINERWNRGTKIEVDGREVLDDRPGTKIEVDGREVLDDRPGTEIEVDGREIPDDGPGAKRWTDLSHGERLKLTEEFLREQETNKPSKPQPTP